MAGHKKKVPGSARDGGIDTRSTDAGGRQADEVKSHAERAAEAPPPRKPAPRDGEVSGALRDRTER